MGNFPLSPRKGAVDACMIRKQLFMPRPYKVQNRGALHLSREKKCRHALQKSAELGTHNTEDCFSLWFTKQRGPWSFSNWGGYPGCSFLFWSTKEVQKSSGNKSHTEQPKAAYTEPSPLERGKQLRLGKDTWESAQQVPSTRKPTRRTRETQDYRP